MANQVTSSGAQIAAWFRGQGLSANAAAGLAGNFQVESGFNPAAANPRENAIGLAQWQRGRRTNLQAYARETGGSESSLTTQLGFVMRELGGPFRSVLDRINRAGSPGEAATIVDQSYEISSGAARQQRIAAAESIARGGGGTVAGTSGSSIVQQASTYLGIPYVWGAASRLAVDCSGLVLQVFRDLGVTLPRTAQQQSREGTRVASLAQAQPGDLLFFGGGENNITHVGIYNGDGKMTAAPQPGENVKIQSVYETPTIIRRIAAGSSGALGIDIGLDTNTPLIPGGNVIGGDATDALPSFEEVTRWLANAGVVILGVVLLIIAFVFVAKGGESAAGGTDPDDRSTRRTSSTHSPVTRAARLAA